MIKKVFSWLGWNLLCVLIALGALEIAGNIYMNIRYGKPGKTYGIFMSDPELRMIHRPNSFNRTAWLNNYGFRNIEDVTPVSEGGLRIMAVGGSTTFGYNLSENETYPEQLQKEIRKISGYEKTQVFNAGTICYSAGHNLILMKRLIPKLKPDYVIIYEGINEVNNAWVLMQDGVQLDDLKTFGDLGKSYTQADWLLQKSVLAKWINEKGYQLAEKKRKEKPVESAALSIHPWVIENYKFLLNEMIDYVRKEGATPIVVRFAFNTNPNFSLLSNLSAEIANEKNVKVLDMQALFEKTGIPMKDLFIYTGVHAKSFGAHLFAEELKKTILELEDQKEKNKPAILPASSQIAGMEERSF